LVERAISTPYFQIRAGEDVCQRLDDEHLRAHTRIHGRELETDHAAADDQQVLRNAFELNGIVGIEDRVAIARPRLDVDRRATRCDNDRLRGVLVGRAVFLLERDRVLGRERRFAVSEGHVVRLEQRVHAADVAAHDFVFERDDARAVDFGRRHLDADLGRVVDLPGDLADVEQRLGRDAAPIEADAADLVAIEAHDVLSQLPETNRRVISARTRADHQSVDVD